MTFTPRAGALRYQKETGEWICANPHDSLYSTVTMLATEYWEDEWKKIVDDNGFIDIGVTQEQYTEFCRSFYEFKGSLRLGQAFYNRFNLYSHNHKTCDDFNNLFYTSDATSKATITKLFGLY